MRCISLLLGVMAMVNGRVDAQAVGTRAPVIVVTDLDGAAVTLPVAGRPALIEFWATWCDVCEALLPRMVAAQKGYGDRVDFFGVNVTVNESKNRVRRYVTEKKPPFRTLYDEKGTAVRAFGAPATSYVVIIDAKGIIRYTGSGGAQLLAAELAKVVAP